MHTSDKSASGGSPGRSSSMDAVPDADAGADAAARPLCGFPLTRMNKAGGFTCRNPPVKGGRCRVHVDAIADPEAAELERLRLLQEAAERHAFDADRAIGEGENGDKDLSFNRNARLAATLARTRRALAKPKDERAAPETADIKIDDNQRAPATAPASPPGDGTEDTSKDTSKD